jgi:hypothetical protein
MRRSKLPALRGAKVLPAVKYCYTLRRSAVRIAEVVGFTADTQRVKAQQSAAKAAAKSARRAALQLKLRKTQQQLSQLATQ